MSKAYKCDICHSFYDKKNDIPTATQTTNHYNYIRLNDCVVQLVEYNTKYYVDVCPRCTEKLQKIVDDIRGANVKQSCAIDGVVDGVEVNYTKC